MSSRLPRPLIYVYSVKYLCGYFSPMPEVFHWTEINVHNPSWKHTVKLRKKFLVAGTQEHPTGRMARESLTLPPNGAFELDCNEIYDRLNLPGGVATKGFVEILSSRPLQVVAIYDKCVKQPRTDVFPVSEACVTVEFKRHPDDEDFSIRAEVCLVGSTMIKKSHQLLSSDHSRFYHDTEMRQLDMRATEITRAEIRDDRTGEWTEIPTAELPLDISELRIVQNPEFPSRGKIHAAVNEALQPVLPIRSFFDVFFLVQVGEALGAMIGDQELQNTTGLPMHATLTQIEPPDVPDDEGNNVYRSPRGAIPLITTTTGQVVAQIAAHHHTPNPPPDPKRPRPRFSPVPCESASIDVEYVRPLRFPQRSKRDVFDD